MATIRIVPKSDWEVLKRYMESNMILIPETTLEQMSNDEQVKLRQMDKEEICYDFAGDADIWMDIAACPNSYCIQKIKESGIYEDNI